MPNYGSFRSQNWLNWKEIYSTDFYSTPWSRTATLWLNRVPLGSQIACMCRHCAWEKLIAKADNTSLAEFDCQI